MNWEYLEMQYLPGHRHTYRVEMWRTPVPGGWLLMAVNQRSSVPQPVISFYPDPNHEWTGRTPEEAAYLLRGAAHVTGQLEPPDGGSGSPGQSTR